MNYQLLHDRILSQAKVRIKTFGEDYETHHIIPRSMGGTDEEANLVSLTTREHFIMHYLLTKITTGEDKKSMIYAFNMMNSENKHQERYTNSHLYEANRKRLVEMQGHKCIIDDIEFPSQSAAARHYGVTEDTIRRWIKEGGKSRPPNPGGGRSCIIDGIEFSSESEAATHYGVSRATIKVWIKEGGKSRPLKQGGGRSCIIDGIEFSSESEAATHYGVSRATIRRWIKEGGKSRPLRTGKKITQKT